MEKILVLLPNNLGDVIMATPVLEGLRALHPESTISFFVENGFEAGIENSPFLDEMIKFPRREIRGALISPGWEAGVQSLRAAIERINATQFDAVLNFSQHEYVSYLVSLLKGRNFAGRRFLPEGNHAVFDQWSQYLYAIPFSRRSNSLHAVDVYRRIAGTPDHCGGYSIELSFAEKAFAKDFFKAKGIDAGRKTMIFQPGAAFPSKCWPANHFVNLGRRLVDDDWQLLLVGAPSDAPYAKDIEREIGKNCFSAVGETSFRQSMALCSMTQGCVTGDTAQMHAAAGLRVPTYALFGPTNPVETGPYGNGHWVFSAKCPERPCFKTTCAKGICMSSISPDIVFSCIQGNGPVSDPVCDTYRTSTGRNRDYTLVPVHQNRHSYFNAFDAYLTKKAFDSETEAIAFPDHEKETALAQMTDWLKQIEYMRMQLSLYLESKNAHMIGQFERIKSDLARFKGIGEFWTAVMNIRLNSVPLLNPVEGIKQSLKVCNETIRQMRNVMG